MSVGSSTPAPPFPTVPLPLAATFDGDLPWVAAAGTALGLCAVDAARRIVPAN